MKILFLTRRAWPDIGGVEKHVREVSLALEKKGHKVLVVSERDIKYPHIKFVGLLYIWTWLFRNRKFIKNADVVHSHDVFIWYLPFRLLYPKKPLINTFHGLEWDRPLNQYSLFQKSMAIKLCDKTVGVGKFLERYLKTRFNIVIYGGSLLINYKEGKDDRSILYLGRLEENTGLLKFLSWLEINKRAYRVDFCGDGVLREKCEKYGVVHGFADPEPFYKKAKYCVPGGYLAALEALNAGCELKLFWNNKIKEDYWKMSPFYKLKGKKLREWAKSQTWDKVADEYLDLYNSTK